MDWTLFALFLAACGGAAATGGAFPPGEWYERLAKPGWTPPNWLFPLAWTLLYIGIAVAAARIAPLEGSAYAMGFWSLQITLNALWTPIFFGLRQIGGAGIVVVLLWGAVLGCIISFAPLDPVAQWLMVPYLVWVSYAAALNITIWRMNPDAPAS